MTHSADTRRPWAQWLALLGAPLAWAVYFLVVYLLAELACQAGLLQSTLLGMTALSLVVVVLTAVALLISLSVGWVAYRTWQQLKRDRRSGRDALQRSQFMALAGVFLAGLFSLAIVLNGLPALVLRPCA